MPSTSLSYTCIPVRNQSKYSKFPQSLFFSYRNLEILKLISITFQFKEPIGSVSPKVNTGDELNTLRREISKPVSLLCPAQAYPTPVYR